MSGLLPLKFKTEYWTDTEVLCEIREADVLSVDKAPRVVISTDDYIDADKSDAWLSPDEARRVANWLLAAADTLDAPKEPAPPHKDSAG